MKKICRTLIDQKNTEGYSDYFPLANEILEIHRHYEKMKISEVIDQLEMRKNEVRTLLVQPNRKKVIVKKA